MTVYPRHPGSPPVVVVSLIDPWRQLFDRYDEEGFGEVHIDTMERALTASPTFRDHFPMESHAELLHQRLQQLREAGRSAITFQHFVDLVSRKRRLSFKCAIHCRDGQVRVEPAATTRPSTRPSSPSLAERVVLVDVRDRQVFRQHVVVQRGRRLPLAMMTLCILQLVTFVVQQMSMSSHINDLLDFHPYGKEGFYRFLTYLLVHDDILGLLFSLVGQMALGGALEVVHGPSRVLFVVIASTMAGGVFTVCLDHQAALTADVQGAFLGLAMAHTAPLLLLHHTEERHDHAPSETWVGMTKGRAIRLLALLLASSAHVGVVLMRITGPSPRGQRLSGWGLLGGVASGLSMGVPLFGRVALSLRTQLSFWIWMLLYCTALLIGLALVLLDELLLNQRTS